MIINGAVKQINGRETKTATFSKRFFLTRSLRVAGFCPRHLNRSTSSCVASQGKKLGGIFMKFRKLILVAVFGIVLLFADFEVKAQTNQPQKNNVENLTAQKWEYCVIYQQYTGETKDKKATGVAIITYLGETGEREEKVEIEPKPKSSQGANVFSLLTRNAVSKAFAKLGNAGWEFIGKFPYIPIYSQEPELAFMFKRPKQ